jgi:penicillin-binding protein 2
VKLSLQRTLWVLLIAVLVGCEALPAAPVSSGTPSAATLEDAATVAQNFLTAWTKGDYQGMYALISPRSQILAPAVFVEAYADVDSKLGIDANAGKRFELHDDQGFRQGATAVVRYTMFFDTAALGSFRDENRTMRLILAQQGRGQVWRVAWSTMDIFEGMAGGAQLVREFVLPTRGTIFDRNGQPIAQSEVRNYAVRLLTRRGNPPECYQVLNRVLRLNVPDAREKYDREAGIDNGYTIGTMSEEDLTRFRPEIDGAGCSMEYRPQVTRLYAGNGIAAQTVGYVGPIPAESAETYVGYPPGALVGLQGIEQAYEKELAGDPGARLVIRMPDGMAVRTIATRAPGKAQDITVTLDRNLQLLTENALASAYSEANWGSLSPGAAAVVINVETGEVLAMASYPTVNPDAFHLTTTWDADTIGTYLQARATINRATQEQYAPASTFKIVSMAVALGTVGADQQPLFTENTLYSCDAIYRDPEGLVRTDWIYNRLEPTNPEFTHGRLNLKQALTSSCDDYYWYIGELLYNAGQSDALKRFGNLMGLGKRTDIDVLDEAEGQIPDPEWKSRNEGRAWGVGDTLSEIIGQGNVQVTAIQQTRMVMGIANGGRLFRPTLIKQIGLPGEIPTFFATPQATPESLPFEAPALNAIRAAMCAVTRDERFGTARERFANFPFDKVSVCGKTGTAQNEEGAPPSAWFVAYAGPAGKAAEIAVVVYVERSREGSEVAAPISRRIIESYYNLSYFPWPDFWYGPYIPLESPGE